jgi:hypothetical protein
MLLKNRVIPSATIWQQTASTIHEEGLFFNPRRLILSSQRGPQTNKQIIDKTPQQNFHTLNIPHSFEKS